MNPSNKSSANKSPAMNQKIFEIGLSVETVSLYLLCCSLVDADTVISTSNLLEMWNSTKDALFEALKNLEKRNILQKIITDQGKNNVYKLIEVKKWKLG